MKPCECGAYGPGSTHTQACRDGKHIIWQLLPAYEYATQLAQARKTNAGPTERGNA